MSRPTVSTTSGGRTLSGSPVAAITTGRGERTPSERQPRSDREMRSAEDNGSAERLAGLAGRERRPSEDGKRDSRYRPLHLYRAGWQSWRSQEAKVQYQVIVTTRSRIGTTVAIPRGGESIKPLAMEWHHASLAYTSQVCCWRGRWPAVQRHYRPGGSAQVNLNLASRATAGANASAAALAVSSPVAGTFSDGSNTLVIDRVQLVLREIELKRADRDVTCTASWPTTMTVKARGRPRAARRAARARAARPEPSSHGPAGDLREVEFEIHKPSDDERGRRVRAANPDFADVSVRVKVRTTGTSSSTPAISGEEGIELSPPLVRGGFGRNRADTLRGS